MIGRGALSRMALSSLLVAGLLLAAAGCGVHIEAKGSEQRIDRWRVGLPF